MTATGALTPRTVKDAAARMHALGAALPPRDGVAVFNGVYLSVTEEITARFGGGYFRHPASAGRLAVLFARRYLDAVRPADPAAEAPACWRPLLQLRHHPGVRPVQFALAGIHAHIGHDLPLAVVDTCRELACEPPALHGDFERVGDLLAGMEERVREELMPGPDLLELADPLTHLVGSWSLTRAREAAWAASRALWALRPLPDLAEEFAHRLDTATGLVARCLLTPLGERFGQSSGSSTGAIRS